jgi:hypothetical protein
MKVIIAGSRDLDCHLVVDALWRLCPNVISEVVSGGALGADLGGEYWANLRNIPIKTFRANWSFYGKSAGPKRNGVMADYADYLIAFWDGRSRGTKDMITQMQGRGKPYMIIDTSYLPDILVY